MAKYCIAALIILLNALPLRAQELDVVVVGLFTDQAVIEVNGRQHLLRAGDTTPEGVTLIAASSRGATLEIHGRRAEYALGDHIGALYTAPPEQPGVSLWPSDGMYLATGIINGYTVECIVDTGASAVALNAATARRLDIDYLDAEQVAVRTASGIEIAYRVRLDYVQLDAIRLDNVDAMVIDGPEPSRALLGMSFLGQLDMLHNGERLELRQKF